MPQSERYRNWLAEHGSENALVSGWYQLIVTPLARDLGPFSHFKMWALLGLMLLALNRWAPADPKADTRWWASLIFVTAAVAVWLWKVGIDRTAPLLPFMCALHATFYALPVFLLHYYVYREVGGRVANSYVAIALEYAWIGMVAMMAGYLGPTIKVLAPAIPRFNLQWHDLRAVKLAAAGVAIIGMMMIAHVIPAPSVALAQMHLYLGDLLTIAVTTFFALQIVGRLEWWGVVLLWGLFIPLRALTALAYGTAGGSLALGLTLAMAYATVSRRIPWVLMIAGMAAYFVIRPIETPYRIATWGGELRDASEVQKIAYFGELAYRATIGGEVAPEVLVEIGGDRLAVFPLLAEIIRETPQIVPYWRGETYLPLLYKPVPRLIYPDKPQEVSGQTFGHRYGLIDVTNLSTSINLAQMVEMYANFGLPGIVIGMFLFGLLARIMVELFVHPGMGLGAVVALVFVASRFWDIESCASLALGSLPWDLVFIGAVYVFVRAAEVDRQRFQLTRVRAVS